MNFRTTKLLLGVLCVITLTSCDPSKRINKDYLLFQEGRKDVVKVQLKDLTIKPGDLLAIQIYSKTGRQDDAAFYNITAQNGYLVGLNGRIELPLIGSIVAQGLTRAELQESIRKELNTYVKEPAVLVRFQQFTINVLGEVNGPGVKTFINDKVTIIDAISSAGDLTPNGLRENVTVIREDEKGVKRLYEIDLRSTLLFTSPVYQLQQNDIVYVNANKQKLKSLKEKTDFGRILQTGLSIIGVATSLYLLFRNN